MIPRCTWPRVKTARGGPEEGAKDEQSPAIPAGPRCAWPRDGVQAISSLSKLAEEEANVVEARNGSAIGNGPKCAWPRHRISAASSTKVISASSIDPSTSQSSPGRGKPLSDPPPAIEGPRCAWPRSTTARRVLATSIGLGLLNSFFIDQGATAFAILLQSPPSSTSKMPGEDDDTLSSYSHRLLP
ncbi:hypothetical protein KP509_24G077800 [Ceratopteris richardii]|nr:hypothetical protein KP509_24G077800 [Ceratopteris richardii]